MGGQHADIIIEHYLVTGPDIIIAEILRLWTVTLALSVLLLGTRMENSKNSFHKYYKTNCHQYYKIGLIYIVNVMIYHYEKLLLI